jgi:branched-chain amino acid transport system ATP-binding protein
VRRHGLVVETEPFEALDLQGRVEPEFVLEQDSYVRGRSDEPSVDPGPQRSFAHDTSDLLSVAGLAAAYGRRVVVQDVQLRVRSGEVVVLLGHNGSGKSATLRAIMGLTARPTGEVVLDGEDLRGSVAQRRASGVGFVPAADEVFAELTVHDNVLLAIGPGQADAPSRVRAALDLAGCRAELWRRRAGDLSGGERRVVGMAIALAAQPKLLLLDEPTKHLANATAERVLLTTQRLAREQDIGVLIAEVNVAAALRVADRVYLLRSGRIEAEYSGSELLAAGPACWWTLF